MYEENIDIYAAIADKLENELKEIDEAMIPAEPITKYLLMCCTQKQEFGDLIMQPHKSLRKCFEYVKNYVYNISADKVRAQNGWLNDQEVYDAAEEYFRIDDAEIERQKAEEQKRKDEAQKQREEQAKIQAARSAAEKEKLKAEQEGQLSFMEVFDHVKEEQTEKAAS